MVAPIYSNKKGIYKDLYREIDSDNKNKELSQAKKARKGIYTELYKQIQFENNENPPETNNLYALAFKKFIKDLSSQALRCYTAATIEFKFLIVALIVAKKPINDYIEYSMQNSNVGLYNNDRK